MRTQIHNPRHVWERNLWLLIRPLALKGEGSNCFSIIQLVGQKRVYNERKTGEFRYSMTITTN